MNNLKTLTDFVKSKWWKILESSSTTPVISATIEGVSFILMMKENKIHLYEQDEEGYRWQLINVLK